VNPILSIIIPTRNRSEYAISAIESVLKIDSNNFELVIQDNGDDDVLKEYVISNISDSRLRYNHIKTKLDVIANFNASLNFASGDYITFIGDDDGVNPEIIDAVSWMKKNDIDSLTPSLIADYMWPDIRMKYYDDRFSGMLRVNAFTGEINTYDVHEGMRESAQKAFQNIVFAKNIPKIYYGIVRRACMDKVFKQANTYFPGVSPDMAGAMSVACYVRKTFSIDYPLFVPGSSAKSTAGLGAEKKHHGRLEDQPHLPEGCWNNWPDNVPNYFSVQTVWAQSGLSALSATKRNDILELFNTPFLYARCIVFNPQFFLFTLRAYFSVLKLQKKNNIIGVILLIYWYFMNWMTRVSSMLNRIISKFSKSTTLKFTDINNIAIAVEELTKFLKERNVTFNQLSLRHDSKQD
jgi:glycosyltransferase involved in cell wall biosynthesis